MQLMTSHDKKDCDGKTNTQEPRKMKMQLTAGRVDQLWTKAE